MNSTQPPPNPRAHQEKLETFYATHAKIYDWTRWLFLFGRAELLRNLFPDKKQSFSLLEIGSGTGQNLRTLCSLYPNMKYYGVESSKDMFHRAKRKARRYQDRAFLFQQPYAPANKPTFDRSFDVVLFSYSLSMMSDSKAILKQAKRDLRSGGTLAAVDFHDSAYLFFHQHMRRCHVNLSPSLLKFLKGEFSPEKATLRRPYFGLWTYFLFLGKNVG